ncbi:hypothetical protein PIB30_108360, partial [Stylosanthes scabra]|nr:hypothetical protein [Stylosanthes scabra]
EKWPKKLGKQEIREAEQSIHAQASLPHAQTRQPRHPEASEVGTNARQPEDNDSRNQRHV